MRIETRHRWRYFDTARRRIVTARHHCTAEAIQRGHPDAGPVDGTRIERQICETPAERAALSASGWIK